MSLSSRPYLIRGLYDWMTENNLTPQVLINTNCSGVKVPEAHVANGQIVLNIAMTATKDLLLGDDQITFNARFSGRPHQIILPIESVLAIFASEVDAGMSFGSEPALSPADNKLLLGDRGEDEQSVADFEAELRSTRASLSAAHDDGHGGGQAEESDEQANVIHVQFGRDDDKS